MINTHELKGFPKSSKGVKFKPNKPISTKRVRGDIGLELEIEGSNLARDVDLTEVRASESGAYWTIHPDGSLRNGGLEYTLSGPCFKKEVPDLVEGLFKAFETRKTKLDLTNRTSTHVHVNVSDLKANALTSYIILWSIFEEALVNWCGDQRKGNLFCLRSKDSTYTSTAWGNAIRTGKFSFTNDYKYMGLNLGAFSRFGSFEFRTLRGAENPKLVIDWVNILLALKEEARTIFDNPYVIAEILSAQGPDGLFTNICEKHELMGFCDEVMKLEDNVDFNTMCLQGFRNSQSIVYEIDWNSIIDKCREEYIFNPFEKGTNPDPLGDILRAAPGPPLQPAVDNGRFITNLTAIAEFHVIAAREYPEGINMRNQISSIDGNRYRLSVRGGVWYAQPEV